MVTVLAAESGEHQLAVIGLAVAVGVLNETHVRFLAHARRHRRIQKTTECAGHRQTPSTYPRDRRRRYPPESPAYRPAHCRGKCG